VSRVMLAQTLGVPFTESVMVAICARYDIVPGCLMTVSAVLPNSISSVFVGGIVHASFGAYL
jgi:hypothetical protein